MTIRIFIRQSVRHNSVCLQHVISMDDRWRALLNLLRSAAYNFGMSFGEKFSKAYRLTIPGETTGFRSSASGEAGNVGQ